jgi:NAD(P)H-dependent FMN reductase
MSSPRILAFAGSARSASFNRRLLRVAVRGAEANGVACTVVELRDYPLPIYDADGEARDGLPENAAKLRELFASHQGLLIASPEYNSSIAPLLKNTVDWVSRSPAGSADLAGFQGRLAAILAASPGPLGGLRGLALLRSLLCNIGVTVLANQVTLRQAAGAFDDAGELVEPRYRKRVEALGDELAEWLLKQHNA